MIDVERLRWKVGFSQGPLSRHCQYHCWGGCALAKSTAHSCTEHSIACPPGNRMGRRCVLSRRHLVRPIVQRAAPLRYGVSFRLCLLSSRPSAPRQPRRRSRRSWAGDWRSHEVARASGPRVHRTRAGARPATCDRRAPRGEPDGTRSRVRIAFPKPWASERRPGVAPSTSPR